MKRSVKPVPVNASETRAGEGVMLIVQHNADKALIIERVNETAANILGYEVDEMKGKRIEAFLGSRTAEFLTDEVEYADDAPDFADVLARHRVMRLRHRSGEESAVECTVSRVMSEGMNARFQLVIPNEREVRANQKIRDFITLNLAGRMVVEPKTSLPNHHTAEEFLPLLKNFLAESEIEAAFAILRIDRFDKSVARYGRDACVGLLQHAAECCRTTFRSEDLIFALSDRTIGLVLFDISRESARLVLGRLRWSIRNHRLRFGDKSDFTSSVTVLFDMLDQERGDGLLARCESAMEAVSLDERNSLVELPQ
ncbi:MAG: diguanylate cyclase domain-containing protein [Rickettsiales bacterium]